MEEGRAKRIAENWADILMGLELPYLGTLYVKNSVPYHLQQQVHKDVKVELCLFHIHLMHHGNQCQLLPQAKVKITYVGLEKELSENQFCKLWSLIYPRV